MLRYTLIFFTSMVLAIGCSPVHAAQRVGRMTIDIQIDGKGRQQKGASYSTFTTHETVHVGFTLESSGEPEDINRLDITVNNAAVQKQVAQAKARTPDRAGQEAVADRTRVAMEACKGDLGCMSQIAQKMGQQTAAWNALPPDNSANEGRFLTFFTPDASQCKGEFTAKIQSDTEGKRGDVQGLVPFSKTERADYRATALQALALCNGMIVLDTRENHVFAYIPDVEVKGHKLWTEDARTTLETKDGEIRLNQDALVWAAKQLHNAAKSGTRKARLKIPIDTFLGGVGENILDVQISWKFDIR
jgi:hypothetical protein